MVPSVAACGSRGGGPGLAGGGVIYGGCVRWVLADVLDRTGGRTATGGGRGGGASPVARLPDPRRWQFGGRTMYGYTKLILWLLLLSSSSPYFGLGHGVDPDVQCLKDLKQSLIDPNGILESSWNFADVDAPGYSICEFTGVECWHPDENKVLGLRLGNLGLEGPFPAGLELCGSMTTLDLSGNSFSGPLPEHITGQESYMGYLDLSDNSFSGGIPASFENMTYLNVLALQHNKFDGRIPALSNLSRLLLFSVADNSLSGPVPDSLQSFPSANFTGNRRLCGPPLDKKCKKRFRIRIHIRVRLPRINDASSIGAAAGFIVGFVVAFYFPHRFLFCRRLRPYVFRVCG